MINYSYQTAMILGNISLEFCFLVIFSLLISVSLSKWGSSNSLISGASEETEMTSW